MTTNLQVVLARRGRAVRLAKGQAIQIINTHGQQVVDTWCFNADDLSEFMSMEHLHAGLQGIFPPRAVVLQQTGGGRSLCWRRIPRLDAMTRSSRPAMFTDMPRWAAATITTIARTTCTRPSAS